MILVIDHPIHLRFRMFSQSLTHDPWVKPTPIPVWLLGRSRHPPGSVPSVFGQMSIPLSIGPILCIVPIGRIYIHIHIFINLSIYLFIYLSIYLLIYFLYQYMNIRKRHDLLTCIYIFIG